MSLWHDKCLGALDFHHRDPSEKEFDWNKLRKRSWESIAFELDKCDLLCSNCHRESHYDENTFQLAKQFLDMKSASKKVKQKRICRKCGIEYFRKFKIERVLQRAVLSVVSPVSLTNIIWV